jgi:endogenous inhibitor of DNA gyrase (YacG/DUF329 family)
MQKPCPTCGQPVEWEDNPNRPFCSERCRLIDLGRWADEEYAVADENDASEADGLPEDFQPS